LFAGFPYEVAWPLHCDGFLYCEHDISNKDLPSLRCCNVALENATRPLIFHYSGIWVRDLRFYIICLLSGFFVCLFSDYFLFACSFVLLLDIEWIVPLLTVTMLACWLIGVS